MVKRVLTSIITLAVLMGSVVACSGSDSEVAELRAELEEIKKEKNQETANTPQATPIPNPTPATPDFEENEWTNEDSTTLREECEEVASTGIQNTNGITSFCINVKDWAESFTNNDAEKYCAKEKMIALVDKYRTAVVNNEDTQAVWDSEIATIEENCQMKFCSTYNDWKKDVDGGFNPKPPNINPAYSVSNPDPLYPYLWVMCVG